MAARTATSLGLGSARGFKTSRRAHRPDYGMVFVIYALLLWGLIMIYSMGPILARAAEVSVTKQLFAIFVGSLAFFAASKLPTDFWRKILPLMITISIIMTLLLVLPLDFIAEEANGARRWLDIAGISFQPSELVKLTLVLYFGVFLASRVKHRQLEDRKATLIPALAIIAVTLFFVAGVQRDLGTAMVIVAISLAMLYVAGVNRKDLATIILIGLAGAVLMILIAPHRISRVTTFLNPGNDPIGSGYHIQQSLIAVGSGGVSGVGVGRSVQAFGYLPEAANDSIFAIHAETIGFIGVLVLLGAFAYLLRRIHLQALAAHNLSYRLVAVGVFTWVMSHMVINIGAMIGLMPVTGITLPLLSYGGSSLVVLMLAFGIIFQLSRYSDLGVMTAESPNRYRERRR